MLRDLKIFRKNSVKTTSADANDENAAPAPESTVIPGTSFARVPFNAIQEALVNHAPDSDQETALKRKIEKTPSKARDAANLRTPEKPPLAATPAGAARNRFGWAMKNDSESNASKTTEDSRTTIPGTTQLLPLDRGTFTTPRMCKTTGRAYSVNSECSSAQCTPNKSVSKPFNTGFGGNRGPSSVSRAPNSAQCSKQNPLASFTPSTVNTIDVPHFELKEDPSFWMDHNVQVVIRIRPINSKERGLYGYSRCLRQDNSQSISWIGQPDNRFTFDHVACETINQESLFRVVGLPMVENCMSGYNSCIFAFGQTGSGKTYTMLGEINELGLSPCPDRGMTPRIFEFLFARIKAEEETRRDENLRYACKCSFLEIYNEQITDLLEPSSTNLLLREDANKGVYVENLSEFQVETVNDVLRLLIQGSANRKIAATNMNRESSRSHSVFTCVIESRWEKDSTSNFRFARLNLVDLAGSERQKTSGAEGERLKEAASINKSLSTLGHVIMVLVDVARGKNRHVPYRDSRLTFLLQDSLGGNSKTMVIANVSPSISCASETLSTLKFAQRAKLIQNNAIVNEDASEDVTALQHQIKLLKEELAMFKTQNVSRSLSFRSAIFSDRSGEQCNTPKISRSGEGGNDVSNSIRLSSKQLKSLEIVLAGALRREKVADTSIKQLQAEIEQLNRLVRQREEDTQGTKMMLKFREDKIQRMENLLKGSMPTETYLKEDNTSLREEIQLLHSKIDRHPEVTRFALENIRLLDQLRRFQEFYEEGEREILLEEVAQLRNQVLHLVVERSNADESKNLTSENQIGSNAEVGALQIELANTQQDLEDCRSRLQCCLQENAKLTMEVGSLQTELQGLKALSKINAEHDDMELCSEFSSSPNQSEDILCLQLELDILKAILEEERECRSSDRNQLLEVSKHYEHAQKELKEARSIIEVLESQELLLISEMDELRRIHKPTRNCFSEALKHKSREETLIKEEVSRQAEAETAEVIVCLQEEITTLREDAEISKRNEAFARKCLSELESEIKNVQEKNLLLTQDNERLNEIIELKDDHLRASVHEIADILSDGNTLLDDCMVDSFPVRIIKDIISERDAQIHDLRNRLEDAQRVEREMDWKLRSLRGATLAITEAHQQENTDRERNILLLTSELSEQKSTISFLQNTVNKSMLFAAVAFSVAAQLSETNSAYLKALEEKELEVNYSHIMLLQEDAVLRDLEMEVNAYEEKREKMMQDFNEQLTCMEKYIILREEELESALQKLDRKIRSLAGTACQSLTAWSETKKELDLEVIDAKMVATEKESEALTVLSTLNEAQETVDALEREYQECETFLIKMKTDLADELMSATDDIIGLKSRFLLLADFARRSLEDVWLEIIDKDCIVSVMNVCYAGIIRDLIEQNSQASSGLTFLEKVERDEEQLQEEYCFQNLQSCIFQSELREKTKESNMKSARLVSLERERGSLMKNLERLREEVIFLAFEGEIGRKFLLDLEAENENLERDTKIQMRERDDLIREMQVKMENLQHDFQQSVELEMELNSQISKLQMQVRDSARSYEIISNELSSKNSEMDAMVSELHLQRELNLSSHEEQNHKLRDEIELLRLSISSLENELEKKNMEITMIANSHPRFCTDLESERTRAEVLTSRFSALERENEKLKNERTISKTDETAILLHSLRDELDGAISKSQLLAEQLTEKSATLSSLESNLSKQIGENADLKAELTEKGKLIKELEIEVMDARNLLNEKDHLIERLFEERERVDSAIIMLEEKLEMARALAEEHEAIAMEAKQIAELKKSYAEEKEEEVRLLERSVEELECTVNMLENKVEIVKEEAEKHRLQREELEIEIEVVRNKILGLESSSDYLMKVERESVVSLRHLDQKLSELEEARKQIEALEKDVENKESEIIQCKAHIAELNLHAEAQARENKHRIKELEAMAYQVNSSSQGSNKQEKMATKARGSGSPFKCIGLGLTQQMNSEKDEELTAARSRIEELEAMATRRQKEIFMLNARLANAESMTHDVIRDLLGVKHDMSNYASLLDEHRSDTSCQDPPEKDQLIVNLKERLMEFLNERESWVNEMMSAKTALEGLREREQLLSADNEILKATDAKHKKSIAQLEDEVKRLQREQNLQHRIHHHIKIKEENVSLRAENEELMSRLRRSEEVLSRLKVELGHRR